jgi:hypothetical protein
MEDSDTPKDNMTELTITGDNELPRNQNWRQVFRDNETGTCVLDSLQKHLSIRYGSVESMPKNKKTSYNALEKLKKKYQNGVGETELQDIADKVKFTIDLRFMIPTFGLNKVFTPSSDPQLRVTLMNTRPHHVQLYTGLFDAVPIPAEDFTDKISYYHHTPLYLARRDDTGIQSLVTQDGVFYKDKDSPFDTSCFFDQYTFHRYTEKFGCDQALTWANGEIYISSVAPTHEYDMNQAYLQYPHSYAGYLLHEEEGFFPSSIIPDLVRLYENEFSTVLVHITLQSQSLLEQMFQLPTYLIVPLWFASLLQDFYITKIDRIL